jgi:uncharacterized protein YecE (DUF72 family)
MTGNIRIGTSGWHYPHWRGPFYPADLPAGQMLEFYVRHFSSVEVNNSFYRLPTSAALQSWRNTTPNDFCFAVKASRFLTHMKKLKDPETGLAKFLARVEQLGERLGPVLFQLPPRWRCNLERLACFLAALPEGRSYSFELRDPSWHVPNVYCLLGHHNVAFCIYELSGFQSPLQITADFVYVRLHGPEGAYQGSYSTASLEAWARRLREWGSGLKGVYVYFDNDQAGFAARNALELKRLLDG